MPDIDPEEHAAIEEQLKALEEEREALDEERVNPRYHGRFVWRVFFPRQRCYLASAKSVTNKSEFVQ